MSLRINTNVAALNSYNNLNANQTKLEGAFQQLSSGLRINKAADDAAGLSIAQGLTSQINGLTQAVSNANDGINVAQIADGALGTTQDILQRMRGLVVKAGNVGTQDGKSLSAIQAEINNLNTQLTNIAGQTKFGQTNLLDGTYNKNFQVGANGNDTIALNLTTADTKATTLGTDILKIAKVTPDNVATYTTGSAFDTAAAAHTYGASGSPTALAASATAGLATALNTVVGSGNYWLVDNGNGGFNVQEDSTGAPDGTTVATLTNANGDMWTMSNIDGSKTYTMGVKGAASATQVYKVATYSTEQASDDLADLNDAIDTISSARSQIGAVQNQLNYTVSNLQTAITNVTASRSNLTDADLAQQVTAMTQSQILTQAATSVLAQANSAPQAILKLLQ